MPPSRERAGERGFTLIEVLVALVVTSLILAIVMNASLQAKSRSLAALDKEEAVTLARGLIAGRMVAPFEAAARTGTSDGLGWAVDERAIATNPTGLLLLSEVRVTVRNANGATLATLTARRIKAAPKP
jgi:prepilin-type N-terminal cleavage/methylation domain-containing protein